MRILQIINSLNSGGAEKLVVEISKRYQLLGNKVTILLLNGQDTYLLKNVRNIEGIQVVILGDRKNIYNPINILKIVQHLLSYKYDIIHVHLFPSLYWAGISKLFMKNNGKLIYTEHNTTNTRRDHWLLKRFDKLIYKKYDALITISNAVDESLREHLKHKFSNIHQIYNGIDLTAISKATPYSSSDLGLIDNAKILVQVSSFTHQKNQRTLIKSLLHLNDNIVLLLVGDGPTRKECEELVKKLSLQNRVQFLGIRDDVPKLLKTSDIVVLSSHFEGLSLASIEGLASGRPFIASDVPGLTEVVENAGVLFENGNDEMLAESIGNLLKDDQYYSNTAAKCMDRAKLYDIRNMVCQYLELYTSKLNEAKKSKKISA